MNYEDPYAGQTAFFDAPWLKGCSFANEWRNEWRRILRAAARVPQTYPPQNPEAVFAVAHTFQDTPFTFHFDLEKVWDWFRRDSALPEHRVFLPRELTRNLEGEVGIRDSQLTWDPAAPEPEPSDGGREILVCSLPGTPPPLRVISGNRRGESSFTGFKKRKLPLCLIQAEFTPAFLADSFEVALYLFWMDVCILMENRVKLKDKDLQPLLHVFRPSSLLTIKGLK